MVPPRPPGLIKVSPSNKSNVPGRLYEVHECWLILKKICKTTQTLTTCIDGSVSSNMGLRSTLNTEDMTPNVFSTTTRADESFLLKPFP